MKILFFDTETTGVPKNYKASYMDTENWPRLVQLGVIFYVDGDETASSEMIVRPDGFIISEEVSKIHGITQEKALVSGYFIEDVLASFSSLLWEADLLVGHNLNYDLNVLGSEFYRSTKMNPLAGKATYDTMQKSTNLLKLPGKFGNYKWPKLQELYQFLFNEPLAQTHTALDDIRQTAKCYFELQRRGVA